MCLLGFTSARPSITINFQWHNKNATGTLPILRNAMAYEPTPKAFLFDIGGVLVISPMSVMADYEVRHGIPPGYINFSIARSAPNGAWHRAERGEMVADAGFFKLFHNDLHQERIWREHVARAASKLPYDLPEPVAKKLYDFKEGKVPPMPEVDAEEVFWEIMRVARNADPYMYPALKRLKASKRFLLAALSNTIKFPEGHPYNKFEEGDPRKEFDVYVSSAHAGVRKPHKEAYELALEKMREKWTGQEELRPEDVVFSDDIGENLKAAKKLGFRTIKVQLGHTQEAVKELERYSGLSLLEEQSRM